MCDTLEVSKSGYYDWKNRKPSKRKIYNQLLLAEIKEIHKYSGEIYGSPKIHETILKKGYVCNIKLIEKLMRIANIRSKTCKKYKISTTNSNHNLPFSENLLNRNFTAEAPGEVWCSDITYVEINSRWYYLVMIIDLFNREIVGWDLSESLDKLSLIHCFNKAVKQYNPKKNCMFHSDRGIQYASKEFRKKLDENKMKQSMSRKGDCWDNAVAESFFKILKSELINHKNYKTIEEAKNDIFKYIEIFYNRKRIHSTLGFTTPNEYRRIYEKRSA